MKPIWVWLIAGAIMVLAFSQAAYPHDAAQWIQDSQYKDEMGVGCCGPTECRVLDLSEVTEARGGWIWMGRRFDASNAFPSRDGQFWGCARAGQPKCFFPPLNG